MEITKLIALLLCLICLYLPAQAQRAFDAGRLVLRNADGDVIKDLTESPCYKEIGFNPDLSQDAVLREYESCESDKRSKMIWTTLSILFVVGFIGLLVRSNFKKNRPQSSL